MLLCPGFPGYRWPDPDPGLAAQAAALTAAGDADGLVRLRLGVWGAASPEPLVADLMRSSLRAEASEELREDAARSSAAWPSCAPRR